MHESGMAQSDTQCGEETPVRLEEQLAGGANEVEVLSKSGPDEERAFEYLFRLYELYSQLQVDGETLYHNRTSIITLTQGVLFVAYGSLIQKSTQVAGTLGSGLASLGAVLSLLWLFFEQRNAAYYNGRCHVLDTLDRELSQRAPKANAAFASFWIAAPRWVRLHAAWYQRFSAPLILRVFVPGLFFMSWLLVLIFTPLIFKSQPSSVSDKPYVEMKHSTASDPSGSAIRQKSDKSVTQPLHRSPVD